MSFPAKVKELFLTLNDNNKFSLNLAKELCDINYCKNHSLQTEFPVLRIAGESEFSDCGKYRRYYPQHKFNFTIEGNRYVFTNNWFAKNTVAIQVFFEQFLDKRIVIKILEPTLPPVPIPEPNPKPSWPPWPQPSPDEIRVIAESLTHHLKFLHPDIIFKIVESNRKLDSYFREYLSQSNIKIEPYLWEGCSTMFPGIRRANGKTDADYKKKQLPVNLREDKNAIYIDDNSYAKQIWSFIFTQNQFSNQGPKGYELSHIFDHKAVSRLSDELINTDGSDYNSALPLSGLFTCAAGLAYSPRSLVKISDHSSHARRLLQRKVMQLYKDTNILPPSVKLKDRTHEWDVSSFKWGEPVGDPANTDLFLKFRKERIQKILDLKIPL